MLAAPRDRRCYCSTLQYTIPYSGETHLSPVHHTASMRCRRGMRIRGCMAPLLPPGISLGHLHDEFGGQNHRTPLGRQYKTAASVSTIAQRNHDHSNQPYTVSCDAPHVTSSQVRASRASLGLERQEPERTDTSKASYNQGTNRDLYRPISETRPWATSRFTP